MKPEAEATADLGEDRSEWPEVAFIVLNWNNYEDTAECLASLEQIKYPNYRVILVDNGSEDKSGEQLQEDFPWCRHIHNDENVGYTSGINIGIRYALEGDSKYILSLNNDTIVDANFLSPLVKTAETNSNVGIVTGVIRFSETGEIQSAGRRINPYLVKAPHFQRIKRNSEYEVECISGGVALFPSKFLSRIDGLNESYFLGPDDIDICLKAKGMGKKIMVNPDSVVLHKHASSGGTKNPFRYYHATKGRLNIASEYLSPAQKFVFYVLFSMTRLARILQWLASQKFAIIRAILLAVKDYLKKDMKRKRLSLLEDRGKN